MCRTPPSFLVRQARRWTCNDFGPKSIALSRSLDGGAHWSAAQMLVSDNGTSQLDPGLNLGAAVYDAQAHAVYIHYLAGASAADRGAGKGRGGTLRTRAVKL